jgi:hypothetical protein
MGDEITKEQLENMSEKEFFELQGKGPIKPGHIRTKGLNLIPQNYRDKLREMSRKGELPGAVGEKPKVHRNKYGLGYSLDEEDVDTKSLLFARRKK